MKSIYSSLAVSIIASSAATGEPATPELNRLFDLSVSQLVNVQVSGPTRTVKKMNDVPASVTVFNHNELQKMGIDFLYELMNYVPGFQTSRDNDYGATYLYSARGSDTGQDTTAILLLIDGIARQEIRNSSASELSSLFPLERIERIEIIRGPGSALYGSGAFLGIINIITVKDNKMIALRAGQRDRQSVQVQVSEQLGDWHFDAFLSGYKDGGQEYWLDDRLRDALLKTSDAQKIQNYTMRLGYQDTLLTVEHLEFYSNDYYSVSAINNSYNDQTHYADHLSIEQKINWGRLDTDLKASYGTNELEYVAQATLSNQLITRSNPSSADPLIGVVSYEAHDVLLQWLNDWRLSDDGSVQFGAEWHQESLTKARVLANFDSRALANRVFPIRSSANQDISNEVVETGRREILGVYSQLQYRLNPQTEFTLGARYDDYANYARQVSPRLALTRQINDTNVIKAFYGEAFRAASLTQLNVKETLVLAPNPDLKPETVKTSELVWLVQASDFSFSMSGFYNVINHSIDSSGFLNGRRINQNLGTEYSKGVELETTFQINSDWLVRAAVTDFFSLPQSSFRESKRLASLIVNYQREAWWVNLSGYYNSERQMPVEVDGSIDGFTVVNLKLGYQFSNRILADIQIKNMLDANVASAPQSESIHTPIPYRGREASVGLSYAF